MTKFIIMVFLSFFCVNSMANIDSSTNRKALQHFLNHKDALANHITLEKINHRSVLVNNGSASSSSQFLYFLHSNKNKVYINEIMAQTETSAILNYFSVRTKNMELSPNILELGYQFQDQIQENIQPLDAFKIQENLSKNQIFDIFLGQLGQYQFFMRYHTIEQFGNRRPDYIVTCKNAQYVLLNQTLYMGYNAENLKVPQFIVLEDQKKYHYLAEKQVNLILKKSGVICRD